MASSLRVARSLQAKFGTLGIDDAMVNAMAKVIDKETAAPDLLAACETVLKTDGASLTNITRCCVERAIFAATHTEHQPDAAELRRFDERDARGGNEGTSV